MNLYTLLKEGIGITLGGGQGVTYRKLCVTFPKTYTRTVCYGFSYKVRRDPILPALYLPWTTTAKELTQSGKVPQHVKVCNIQV